MTALNLCCFRSFCCYVGIIFILKIRFKAIFRRFKTLLYLGWYNLSPLQRKRLKNDIFILLLIYEVVWCFIVLGYDVWIVVKSVLE